MITDLVFAQAALLAGQLEEKQMHLLKVLCQTSASSLQRRLRDGITVEDCRADFVAAASLLALAAMGSVGDSQRLEQITAGDFTLRKTGNDAASNCLRAQAELMMTPYLQDQFSFRGV